MKRGSNTKKQLIEAVAKVVKKMLNEGQRSGYTISYYATVGEHGETGKTYSNYTSAMRDAIISSEDPEFMDGLEYLGVEPFGSETRFSILYITPKYLNRVAQYIDDPADRKAWMDVASKVAAAQERSGGKAVVPQNGHFKSR